jgi:hypothetical protein
LVLSRSAPARSLVGSWRSAGAEASDRFTAPDLEWRDVAVLEAAEQQYHAARAPDLCS